MKQTSLLSFFKSGNNVSTKVTNEIPKIHTESNLKTILPVSNSKDRNDSNDRKEGSNKKKMNLDDEEFDFSSVMGEEKNEKSRLKKRSFNSFNDNNNNNNNDEIEEVMVIKK